MRALRWLAALRPARPRRAVHQARPRGDVSRAIARAACRRRARGWRYPRMLLASAISLLNASRREHAKRLHVGSPPGGARARARPRLHRRLARHARRQPGAQRDRGGARQRVSGARPALSREPPAVRRPVRRRRTAPFPAGMDKLDWRSLDDVLDLSIAWDLDNFTLRGGDSSGARAGHVGHAGLRRRLRRPRRARPRIRAGGLRSRDGRWSR